MGNTINHLNLKHTFPFVTSYWWPKNREVSFSLFICLFCYGEGRGGRMSLSIIIQITRKKNKRINQARNEKLNDPFIVLLIVWHLWPFWNWLTSCKAITKSMTYFYAKCSVSETGVDSFMQLIGIIDVMIWLGSNIALKKPICWDNHWVNLTWSSER